jgi:hypothetical protein
MSKCMGPKDQRLFADRCFAEATHITIHGPRCTPCAEIFRQSLRDPNTLGNILAGNRARTEEEINRMVKVLQ